MLVSPLIAGSSSIGPIHPVKHGGDTLRSGTEEKGSPSKKDAKEFDKGHAALAATYQAGKVASALTESQICSKLIQAETLDEIRPLLLEAIKIANLTAALKAFDVMLHICPDQPVSDEFFLKLMELCPPKKRESRNILQTICSFVKQKKIKLSSNTYSSVINTFTKGKDLDNAKIVFALYRFQKSDSLKKQVKFEKDAIPPDILKQADSQHSEEYCAISLHSMESLWAFYFIEWYMNHYETCQCFKVSFKNPRPDVVAKVIDLLKKYSDFPTATMVFDEKNANLWIFKEKLRSQSVPIDIPARREKAVEKTKTTY